MKIPELLAPVGSIDELKVAINAGASSVYISGKNYGARKFARNFTTDEIRNAVQTAHLYNVKVYVTVNTLIKQRELESVLKYLNELYSIGVDAVIVQDLGLIELINKFIPNLKIHASTQLNCENQLKLDYLKSKNIKRVILPREMKASEIKELKTDMEVEIFVHGALCYSYSGQCLMSSLKGSRSGNRGTCAQPCRKQYILNGKKDYYLSPKDLCLIDKLNEIRDLNIDCIKIEGRMRSKQYLAIVVSSYRKALNKLKSNKKFENEELNLVFNRGFCEGHFLNDFKTSKRSGHLGLKIGKVMDVKNTRIAIKLNDDIENIPEKGDGLLLIKNDSDYGFEISQNPLITTLNHYSKDKLKPIKDLKRKNKVLIVKKVKQNKKINFNLADSTVYLTKKNRLTKKVTEIETRTKSYIKSKLILTFSVKNKYPVLKARLTLLNKKEVTAEVRGNKKFETPIKKNTTQKTIKNQLLKVDNYPFNIVQININYDGTLFIPISEINRLRRNVFEKLTIEINNLYKNKKENINYNIQKTESKMSKTELSYYSNNINDLKKLNNISRVYLEIPPNENGLSINYMVNYLKKAAEITLDKDYELIWKWPDIAHDSLIKKLNKVKGILNKMNIKLPIMSPNFNCEFGPYSLNITNAASADSLKNYKIITLSPELNKKDLSDLVECSQNKEKLELLVQGSVEMMKTRNKLPHNSYLDDKYPIKESLSNEEFIIFNNEDLCLLDEIEYYKSVGISNFAIDGRWRDENYINYVMKYSSHALANN